jgi:hypothetical protein
VKPFTRDDLDELAALTASTWRSGLDRDWSVPAGTLSWSCTATADHMIDAVMAPAWFLASRRQDSYPDWGGSAMSLGPDARPADLVEALESVTRLLSGIILATPPDVRAVIWRRPRVETRGPSDFAARGALELVLHAHDVCAGLGLPFAPPPGACDRLRHHTRDWPHWTSPGWRPLALTGDPWSDLLRSSGRA